MKYLWNSVFVFLMLQGFAQEKKIPFVQEKITVDGKQDETIWQELPEITGFHNYSPSDIGMAEQQTVAKLFHDGEYLYVSAVYKDTEAKMQVSTLKRDVSIGISDAFVLILDTQNQKQNGYYFAANSYGTQVDGLVERVNDGFDFSLSWNTIWNVATSVEGTNKIYEMAIPLKALNFSGNNPIFGIQMYTRDIKKNSWTVLTHVKRNYRLFDLRFTVPFVLENIPDRSVSRFAVTPSLTANYINDVAENQEETTITPSLDVQYNVSSSLKLDATINPDFSQIDVDQQVTNLTRFAVFFPERRNFFLENSDLFSNLGVIGINPFYSRKVGRDSDIQFGVKLSGNVLPKTRIGVLNVQTEQDDDIASQNYGVLVGEQQLTKNFTTTGFLINRQETNDFEFTDDYNRVVGVNLNFKSNNNRWVGVSNFGKSFSDGLSGNNDFYNLGIWYNKRGLEWNVGVRNIDKNYITDVGFTPRLYNYDAINDEVIREGYTQTSARIEYQKFYEESKTLNSIRLFNYRNNNYFDKDGKITQINHFLNSAVFFKNLSAVYYSFTYDYIDLKYGFDPLNNGNALQPDIYHSGILRVGYNSANNQKFRYRVNVQKGVYYGGDRTAAGTFLNYQLLPFANLELSYTVNTIDLDELGKETFHLARFSNEIFFNNRLNWSTYIQYNTQQDNFNINSRLQWEYKPLSYVYLVVTDNYNKNIDRTNWGVAFKMNYRFDF